MTIFDTIRYPISLPPKCEELLDLPDSLFMKWLKTSDWSLTCISEFPIDHAVIAKAVSNWYMANWSDIKNPNHEVDLNNLQKLKKLIAEYDT